MPRKGLYKPIPPTEAACITCGRHFRATKRRMYCGGACKIKAWRAAHKETS